jgi:hypothetical protein
VRSEEHLHDAVTRIEMTGIRCAVFYEPDDGMGNTAACTEPISEDRRRIFKRFQLWRNAETKQRERGPPR